MELIKAGARIKAERRRQNISQEKLSEMVNVTPHYIYEIERGTKAMSPETLVKISETLKISTDYILFWENRISGETLSEQLNSMDKERRNRAESAFKALLPYIL